MRERAIDGLTEECEVQELPAAGNAVRQVLTDPERKMTGQDSRLVQARRRVSVAEPIDRPRVESATALEHVRGRADSSGPVCHQDKSHGRPCGLRNVNEDEERLLRLPIGGVAVSHVARPARKI